MSPSPSASITAHRLRVERGPNVILDDLSLTIGPLSRVGVVGPNGAGKSTLLAALAGEVVPERGRVVRVPKTASISYFPQEHLGLSGESVREWIERQSGARAAEREVADAAAALASAGAEGAARYDAALGALLVLGLESFEARAEEHLLELGLRAGVLGAAFSSLSGGERAKVALTSVLLSASELLLLDEPTNDLDFSGLERLESFLTARAGGLAVVSHDRSFLERVVTSILELDEHSHRAALFDGGYRAYLEERATRRHHAEEDYATYETSRRALLDRARREREWATTGVRRQKSTPSDHDRAQRDFRLNRTEKLAGRARRTERAIERLEAVDKPFEGWQLRLMIEQAPRWEASSRLSSAKIVRGELELGPFELEVSFGERVLFSGANGSGKTTLIDALLGRVPLCSGTRYLGPSVIVGELGQDRAAFSGGARLLDTFCAKSGLLARDARSLLAKFGLLASHVGRSGSSLSPGERTRAELALFQARGVNLLVLDEPTNHLDLAAIEQLEEALGAFTGTLVIVSHDRRLLEAVEVDTVVELSELKGANG